MIGNGILVGRCSDEVYRKGSHDMAVVSLIHPSATGLAGTPHLVSVSSIRWWPAPGGWKLFGGGPGGRASWQQAQAGGEGAVSREHCVAQVVPAMADIQARGPRAR